jgi:hypothetical protein
MSDIATTAATSLTLGQAAKLTSLVKTTLARAIRRGSLSATRVETGSYSIDGAELARVFPFPAPTKADDATGDEPGLLAHHAPLNATGELVAVLRAQVEDLKCDRDGWRDMAQRLTLAPPKPSQEPAQLLTLAPPKPSPESAMSWWRWLRAG